MNKQLVYDLVTRIFHWLFAGLFLGAFIIAKAIDDESLTYSYHMLAGIILGFIVLLRVIWGFIGTKHARFSGLVLNPKELIGYLKGIISGDKKRWAGHNPASSWAAIIMMLLALGLGLTGYLMSTGDKEAWEDIHEVLANSFLLAAILHVAGILLHTVRHKDLIGLSMINGKKNDVPPSDIIPSARPFSGMIFLGLVIVFSINLFKNFDVQTKKLQLFGSTIVLGENEEDKSNED